jgi:outer membrane biosynthesis protein TonB
MKTKMRKYEEGGDVVDETGMSFGTIKRNTETGELYDTEDSFKPVPKSMPVTETKAKTESKAEPKKESKKESKAESKKSAKEQAKEVIKPPKLPESFEKAGGGKERAKAKVDSGTFSFSKIAKNLRERAGITSYKSGGSVSSASKRADGIAQRGKTRA